MLVTLLGIVKLVRLKQSLNAPPPMRVTVLLLVDIGIVTAPPKPVYWYTLSEPSLFVVKMNWACTVAGNASSRRSGSSFMVSIPTNHKNIISKSCQPTIIANSLANYGYVFAAACCS